ncbi:MAG: hypothetical protein ACREBR_05135 [bacterium]
MDGKKTRKEAIESLRQKGEPIEPNAYCENLIQAEMWRSELEELLNDKEEYRP